MEFTAQGIFDKVAQHLNDQGVQAAVPNEYGVMECRYRGPNGTMCAVGCLIPDEEYDPDFEGLGARDVLYSDSGGPVLSQLKPFSHLLSHLQAVHDSIGSWRSPDSMKSALTVAAEEFCLDASYMKSLTFEKN